MPAGRQLIQSYGGGRFRIGGQVHEGSVLVLSEETLAWPVADAGAITEASLDALYAAEPAGGILVVGCGPAFSAPPPALRAALKAQGFQLEWMDTGAACRTFNVLLTEERAAAAAVLAVE